MQHKINLTPISQFIQTVRAAELGQQKEVKLPIAQARLLTLALSEIMDKLNQDYETMFHQLKKSVDQETSTISVTMDGGGFDNQ